MGGKPSKPQSCRAHGRHGGACLLVAPNVCEESSCCRKSHTKTKTPMLRDPQGGAQTVSRLRSVEVYKCIEPGLLGEKHRDKYCDARGQAELMTGNWRRNGRILNHSGIVALVGRPSRQSQAFGDAVRAEHAV